MTASRVADSSDDPLWFKDAVIYELHVRAFGDSDGDGIGDFDGLTSHLDYLSQLGVTALWLLPFYPSPLRDDGYDIADYAGVNPAYGTLRSFKKFLRAAHARGLRVITEVVLNHTSDQHAWFQRSRRAAAGSRWRDFYVWSDDPNRYSEARIIFEDYETSNWTWDPVAGAYYWHRFFSHQPDLNYDNPEVRSVMLREVDRWLAMGVDGVRLDAIPYLFERDGTTCENLPETHDFLRQLRAHVDTNFPGRMLLAEANQWPEDAVAYFGDGDECHMAFHFPVMPRLFMALRMEDRFPIIDILAQTPAIADGCQWAIFLRNHDELTLEMVTDEERDYMYRAYAADPQMRVNLGIRRRLAPLLGNDRRRNELMHALLLSLPGTPVLYYGDELGMGDNVYLGDRDAVRTPMQWSPDRNAGFSTANPQQLYLPVVIDPDYHFESVNVEAQDRNPASMLWWMRRTIALRSQHPVFGRGELEFLYPENARVLAFIRHDEHEHVLVVANLSRHSQAVSLDLADHRGSIPVEMFGGSEFPAIADGPYHLTLGPHGFYWFSLDPRRAESRFAHGDPSDLPVLEVRNSWHEVFETRDRRLLHKALTSFLLRNRWYAGRQRTIQSLSISDAIALTDHRGAPGADRRGAPDAYLVLVNVEYTEGEPETYVTPLAVVGPKQAADVLADHPTAAVAWVNHDGQRLLLFDALVDATFATAILDAIRRRRVIRSANGAELRVEHTSEMRGVLDHTDDLRPYIPTVEQSNTSVVFGDRAVLKVFRRAQEGENPDLEIGRYLTEDAGFEHSPALLGALEYVRDKGESRTIAVLDAYVPNEGDAWNYTLNAVELYYEHALGLTAEPPVIPAWDDVVHGRDVPVPAELFEAIGPFFDSAALMGRRVAQLHDALATGGGAFEPEAFTTLSQRALYQSMRSTVRPTLTMVRRALAEPEARLRLDDAAVLDAERLIGAERELIARFAALTDHRFDTVRIRVHGDLHLGQLLHAGHDFVIIDFEGEPSRSPTERRIKRSAFTDVAGMMRSFQYAARVGLLAFAERRMVPEERLASFERLEQAWGLWVSAAFLRGYLAEAGDARYVPADADDRATLLLALLLDKALYEIRYDLGGRPEWARIPLRGACHLLEGTA